HVEDLFKYLIPAQLTSKKTWLLRIMAGDDEKNLWTDMGTIQLKPADTCSLDEID
ncbi:unnamed protein product, partial [Rotaria sp. Silwood1]